MTVSPAKQAQQVRAAQWGPEIISDPQSAPTSSTPLWVVSGGSILITSLSVVVTTAMSATATTLNIGTAGGATTLLSAGTLTSLTVGSVVAGIPVLTAGFPAFTGAVTAAPGNITWIATAANTGQCQVYLSYIPLTPAASVG